MGLLDSVKHAVSGPNASLRFELASTPPYNLYDGIQGVLVVNVLDPEGVTAQSVKVSLEGLEHCEWRESVSQQIEDGEKTRTETFWVNYDSTSKTIDTAMVVWGGAGKAVLPAGEHRFTFHIQNPSPLPVSFTGQHGSIRYELRGVIDVPWGRDGTIKQDIHLVAHPQLMAPLCGTVPRGANFTKTPGCLCFASGPITGTLAYHSSAPQYFSPGVPILMTVDIDNQSNRELPKAAIEIRRRVVYHADASQGHHHSGGGFASHDTKEESSVVTKIPIQDFPVPPSTTIGPLLVEIPAHILPPDACSVKGALIQIEYTMTLEVAVPRALDPSCRLPLLVGPPPLEGGAAMPQAPQMMMMMGSHMPMPDTTSAPMSGTAGDKQRLVNDPYASTGSYGSDPNAYSTAPQPMNPNF